MLAVQNGHNEVGRLLIARCARCIPWTNKRGLDAVCPNLPNPSNLFQSDLKPLTKPLLPVEQLALSSLHPSSTPLIPLLLQNPTYPASPHSRDNNGNTPLHHASASGSLKALRILLTAGADPGAKNAYDWDPLAYSQTVAAEVYFKNLVAEFERRRSEGLPFEERKDEGGGGGSSGLGRRKGGAGVRLITDDGTGTTGSGSARPTPRT